MTKNFIYISFLGCVLASCSNKASIKQAEGIIIDVTDNSVAILTENNDTLTFNIQEDGKSLSDSLLAGDSIEVGFAGSYKAGMTATKITVHKADKSTKGSGVIDDAMASIGGYLKQFKYEGLLPAASGPGINYGLTINANDSIESGIFELVLTYKEAENGKDSSFSYTGEWHTLKGIPGNTNAVVWQCVSADENETFNFLRVNETTLLLLNTELEKPESKLNYNLTLVE